MAINSKVIICRGISIDRQYTNVLDYNETQMLNLCNSKKVAERNNYSFVAGKENVISTDFNYDDAIKCNYIAFQNQRYSSKWFFAWIDKVDYVNDGVTRISFTVDHWSTWYGYWSKRPCFTVREHVANDTIGLHTLDEGLSVGRVECLNTDTVSELLNTTFYIGAFCEYDPDSDQLYKREYVANRQIFAYGLVLFKITTYNDFKDFFEYLKQLNNSSHASIEDMHDVFIVPAGMIDEETLISHGFNDPEMNSYHYYTGGINTMLVNTIEKNVTKLYEVQDKYQPVNNKCYCYPYNYLIVDNYAGNSNILKYEDFATTNCQFIIQLALSIGISARCIPIQYEDVGVNYLEQIPMSKLPTCSWSADSYVNWLTQNAVNIQSQILSVGESVASTTNMMIGGAMAEAEGLIPQDTSPGFVASGGMNAIHDIMGLIGTFRKAELLPDVQHGANLGDVNFSSFTSGFQFKKMRCVDENLQVIDNFFSKYGYKVNRLKIPEFNSRTNWNYIQIGSEDNIGIPSIVDNGVTKTTPEIAFTTINGIARKGVTIWHNHDNIGDYSLSNNIVN